MKKIIELMATVKPEKVNKPRSKKRKCVECKHSLFEEINGETICKHCGLILDGPIEYVGLTRIDFPNGIKI